MDGVGIPAFEARQLFGSRKIRGPRGTRMADPGAEAADFGDGNRSSESANSANSGGIGKFAEFAEFALPKVRIQLRKPRFSAIRWMASGFLHLRLGNFLGPAKFAGFGEPKWQIQVQERRILGVRIDPPNPRIPRIPEGSENLRNSRNSRSRKCGFSCGNRAFRGSDGWRRDFRTWGLATFSVPQNSIGT
jgi:hypothetical protein